MPGNTNNYDLLLTVLRTHFEILPTFLDLFQPLFIKHVFL